MEQDLILRIRGDMTDLLKQIKSVTGEKIKLGVDSIKGGAGLLPSGGGGKETGGILKNVMGGAMLPMLKALAPLAILGTILTSSKAMMASLKQVFKVIQLIVKPIGDIMSVGLMPIIQILKPIGRLFNSLMKPYLMKAREAMRLGGKFLKEGEYKDAAKAYLLGFEYMMKPITDLLIRGYAEITKAPIRLMKIFGQGLVALGDKLPGVGKAFKYMGEELIGASTGMITKIDKTADSMIKFTDDTLDRSLGGMLATLMVKTGETTTDVIDKFERMGLDTTSITAGMKTSLKTQLENMSSLSDTEAKKVKENVLTALGTLSTEADTPMSAFKGTVIGWLEAMKEEADILLGVSKEKYSQDWIKKQPSYAPYVKPEVKSWFEKQPSYAPKTYTTKDIPSYLYKGGEFQGTISGKKVSEKEWAKDVAKSYQMGTPYVPETGLYELHRGERILNATENKEITPVLDKIKDFGTNLTTNNLNNFYNTKNITENIIKPVNIPLEFPSIPSNINKTENKTIEKKETKNITYNISLPSINITVNEMRNERDISELASQIGEEIISNIKNRVGN